MLESRQLLSTSALLAGVGVPLANLDPSAVVKSPSASTVNPDTGNTIAAVGNPNGSITTTTTTPDGQSSSTTTSPPTGQATSWTNHDTGVTTTITYNPDTTKTTTKTDSTGEVISTTTTGTPKPQDVPQVLMLVYDIHTGNDYPIFASDFDYSGITPTAGDTQNDAPDNTGDNTPDNSANNTPDTPDAPTGDSFNDDLDDLNDQIEDLTEQLNDALEGDLEENQELIDALMDDLDQLEALRDGLLEDALGESNDNPSTDEPGDTTPSDSTEDTGNSTGSETDENTDEQIGGVIDQLIDEYAKPGGLDGDKIDALNDQLDELEGTGDGSSDDSPNDDPDNDQAEIDELNDLVNDLNDLAEDLNDILNGVEQGVEEFRDHLDGIHDPSLVKGDGSTDSSDNTTPSSPTGGTDSAATDSGGTGDQAPAGDSGNADDPTPAPGGSDSSSTAPSGGSDSDNQAPNTDGSSDDSASTQPNSNDQQGDGQGSSDNSVPDVAVSGTTAGTQIPGALDEFFDLSPGASKFATFLGWAGNIFSGYIEFTQGSVATTTGGKAADAISVAGVGFIPPVSINQAIGGAIDTIGILATGHNPGVADVIGLSNYVRLLRAYYTDLYSFVTGDPQAGNELHAVNNAFLSGHYGAASQGIAIAGDAVGGFITGGAIAAGQWLGLINDNSQPITSLPQGPTISPQDIGPIPTDVPDSAIQVNK